MKTKNFAALVALMFASITVQAQSFAVGDNKDYSAIGVYDTWEESPFRTGVLAGNVQVVQNPYYKGNNLTGHVLGIQRSRFGSNTFGARVDLSSTVTIGRSGKYVHVLVYSPIATQVQVIGLGKRSTWSEEPTTVEQFWSEPASISANTWTDMVFQVYTNEKSVISSIVVVPSCESPHTLTSDFVTYVDEIVVNSSSSKRTSVTSTIDPYDESETTDPDTPEIDPDPDPEPTSDYPISFDSTQVNYRPTQRYVKGATLKEGNTTIGTYTETTAAASALVYKDMTGTVTWDVQPGHTYTASISYQGDYMHSYAYIDYDNDGQFTPALNSSHTKIADGSELVAYSAFCYGAENSFYNSVGTSVGDTNMDMPSFTIPSTTTPGIYRMRLKVDWNCINPAGGSDSDTSSKTSNNQNIIKNGGGIIDVLLNVHADAVDVSAAPIYNGGVNETDGSTLRKTTDYGTSFNVGLSPAVGFQNGTITIRHGYNLTGEQYVHGNRQWEEFSVELAETDEYYTVAASVVDGNIYISNVTYQPILTVNSVNLYQNSTSYSIPSNMEETVDVYLYRTPLLAQKRNTFCVPFDMNLSQLKEAFGPGVALYAYQTYSSSANRLYYVRTSSIEAGVPYIVVPDATAEESEEETAAREANTELDDSEARLYIIKNVSAASFIDEPGSVKHGAYTFYANFDDQTLPADFYTYDETSGVLKHATTEREMKGFRAYFKSTDASAKALTDVVFDDAEATSIDAVESSDAPLTIYNVNGVLIRQDTNTTDALPKGVHIVNGKKMMVK